MIEVVQCTSIECKLLTLMIYSHTRSHRTTPKIGSATHTSNFDDLIEQTRQRSRVKAEPVETAADDETGESGCFGKYVYGPVTAAESGRALERSV